MGLSEYGRKRDFERTPEPRPAARKSAKAAKSGGNRRARATASKPAPDLLAHNAFVVHKHDASHLHYDLRLRVGDVLRCWAVPKGPSLDPREKRLAVETEDHPVEYARFEGTIPQGQYGGGTMMVWDSGTWAAEEGDPVRALKDGMLKFRLNGERLKGRWMLVRTKREAAKPRWLLVKERDADAAPGVHSETFATSTASGRTMDEIAAGSPARSAHKPAADAVAAGSLKGARPGPMPARVKPQLAEAARIPPEGNDWQHEVKFDGYRLLIFRKPDSVRIVSRSGLDWTARFQHLAKAVTERLSVDAVLDGEAVMLDTRGVSDFQALQNAIHSRRSSAIVFFAFDIPWCDGYDLTRVPLEQRVGLLEQLLGSRQDGRVRMSQHVVGNGPAAFEGARAGGLEGIVSKRLSSPYTSSRTPSWIKVKGFNQQEFVIGGFSPPEGSRERFGALLLGYYNAKGCLQFAGKVGTGFSRETLADVARRLAPLEAAKPAFVNPPTGAEARGVTWVKPELVAQVQFLDWTAEGSIRHTSFKGLRDDIDPATVAREAVHGDPVPPRETEAAKPAAKRVLSASTAAPVPAAKKSASDDFRLTNPDRVVFPDRGAGYVLTKRQVADYYAAVAALMLPHVVGRPLSVLRCPTGEGGKIFFQKHPAKGMPSAIKTVELEGETGQSEQHLMVEGLDGLIGLVQMNVLEIHPWGAMAASPEHPDRLIFDLDPGPGVTWKQTIEGALMLRDAIAQVGLTGFARLSGGKGIHVVVPIRPERTWDEAKTFSMAVAQTLVRLAPRRFIATATLAKRKGLIYIDYLRNARGATAIAPYSTRARPGAPVALPVGWDELTGFAAANGATVPAVKMRVAAKGPDPWQGLAGSSARLPGY